MRQVFFALWVGFFGLLGSSAAEAEPQLAFSPQSLIEYGDKLSGACQRCHGVRGMSRDLSRPNLAGQSETYLKNQLMAFRKAFRVETLGLAGAGTVNLQRRHPDMSERAGRLNDKQIKALSAYFANLPCVTYDSPPVRSKPELADQCDSCHSADGKDHEPYIPYLAGQNRDYLIGQLVALREGTFVPKIIDRDISRQHEIMTRQAANLNNNDIIRLSAYYAASPCQKRP